MQARTAVHLHQRCASGAVFGFLCPSFHADGDERLVSSPANNRLTRRQHDAGFGSTFGRRGGAGRTATAQTRQSAQRLRSAASESSRRYVAEAHSPHGDLSFPDRSIPVAARSQDRSPLRRTFSTVSPVGTTVTCSTSSSSAAFTTTRYSPGSSFPPAARLCVPRGDLLSSRVEDRVGKLRHCGDPQGPGQRLAALRSDRTRPPIDSASVVSCSWTFFPWNVNPTILSVTSMPNVSSCRAAAIRSPSAGILAVRDDDHRSTTERFKVAGRLQDRVRSATFRLSASVD